MGDHQARSIDIVSGYRLGSWGDLNGRVLWKERIEVGVTKHVNPLRAKFFRGNINIFLHFVSFLHIDTTQVVEIFNQIRHEPTYST